MAIGLNSDADFLSRATNIGSLGICNFTLCGWYYRASAGQTYANTDSAGICAVSHSSNGRDVNLGFDSDFDSGAWDDPDLAVGDHVDLTPFAPGDENPTADVWVFYSLRGGAAAGGTVTAEWSVLNSGVWHTQTHTNAVEGSVQGEVVHLGRKHVGDANTAQGWYAYWHAYTTDIGQAASRALVTATTPQNSPWAFWPLDDNTDTADDSGNSRTLTFNGTITSETSPVLTVVRQFFLIHP